MSEIRPTLPDVASRPAAPGPSAAAKAAQAAFFQAALGATRPGMATQLAAQATVSLAAPARSEPASTTAPTDRLPRPGSLLDIRV